MVYTTKDLSGWKEALGGIGDTLSQVLKQRAQKKEQEEVRQESATLLAQALATSEIDSNTGTPNLESLIQNVYGAIEQGANPDMATSFLKNYGDISKDRNANIRQQHKDLSEIEAVKLNLKNEKIISDRFQKLEGASSRDELEETISDLIDEGIPYETIKKQLDRVKLPELTQTERTKISQLKTAEKNLEEMDRLTSTGYAGTTFGFPIAPYSKFGQRGKDRAKLEKLGQSLIPIVAAGVSIRNQKEFDEYKSIITNPNARLSSLRGAIEGLKFLVKNQLDILEPRRNEKGKQGSQRLQKVSEGTILTEEIALQIYDNAGKDKGKSRELAKKLGYKL